MFGYDVTTSVAGLVFLGAALSIVPLILARNFVEIIKPAAIGAGAWVIGSLTTEAVVGIATGLIGLLVALLGGLLDELGVQLPFSLGVIVLFVVALALLSRSRGKSQK